MNEIKWDRVCWRFVNSIFFDETFEKREDLANQLISLGPQKVNRAFLILFDLLGKQDTFQAKAEELINEFSYSKGGSPDIELWRAELINFIKSQV
jgi:hypothetical protein